MRRSSSPTSQTLVLLAATMFLVSACDKATLPRWGYEKPPTHLAPLALRVVLDDSLQRAVIEQSVCDNQVWQGKVGPALVDKIQEKGKARIRQTTVTTADSASSSGTAQEADYQVTLRLLHQDFVAKDRTGSTDQYQARMDLELAAIYQAILADGTAQTLGEGPLRFSENFGVFTPRVGQAGGRCLTNSLDTALDRAAESLADQLFGVAVQLPAGGPAGAVAAQPAGQQLGAVPAPPQNAAGQIMNGQGTVQNQPIAPTPSVPAPAVAEAPAPRAKAPPGAQPYAVVIGIRSYRSPWPAEGMAVDVNQIVRTLREQAGIPLDHLMVLEDELANRLDIEDALTQWLGGRVNSQSIVYLYFFGHAALETGTGEILLAPYDASPTDPGSRFLSLRRLQTQLSRVNAKLALTFIDAPLTPVETRPGGTNRKNSQSPAPNWRGALKGEAEGQGLVLQFARNGQKRDGAGHLLDGLSGGADLDQDGQVTAGELLKSLKGATHTAPLVSASSPILKTVLSRPAQ